MGPLAASWRPSQMDLAKKLHSLFLRTCVYVCLASNAKFGVKAGS